MMQVQVDTPLVGAAYQVLFERLDPANCRTVDRRNAIVAEMEHILRWVRIQELEIAEAYASACKIMVEQIDRQLSINAFGAMVTEAAKSIPRPPMMATLLDDLRAP